jgi:hypothetical protein
MQRIWGTATDGFKAAPGATVSVYVAGGFNLATIYDPSGGATPVSSIGNPMTADGQGRWCCAVPTGYYTVITESGSGPQSAIQYIETISVPDIVATYAPKISPIFTTSATFSFLTNTRVHFSGASGALTDNANFTYTVGTGLKVADSTASNDPITGALIVTGGLGVSGQASFSTSGTIQYTANGGQWVQGQSSELLTIAAAATTDTTANLLPAGAIIKAVVVRVVTVIPTAATFSVGDATTVGRFAAGIAVAANTTAVGLTHMSGASTTLANGPSQAAAAKIRITPNSTPATATGVVRITVFYEQFVAPTS